MKGDRELFRLMVRGEDSRDYPVGVSGETQRKFESALEDWVWWIQRIDSVRGWELISHGGDEYLWELPNGDLRANGWLTADGITDVVRAVVEGRIVTWGQQMLRVVVE